MVDYIEVDEIIVPDDNLVGQNITEVTACSTYGAGLLSLVPGYLSVYHSARQCTVIMVGVGSGCVRTGVAVRRTNILQPRKGSLLFHRK